MTDTVNPLYNPVTPSLELIYLAQSSNPLYYLSASDFPISAASLVLTKSKGYTQVNPVAPASPPANKFPMKNLNFSA